MVNKIEVFYSSKKVGTIAKYNNKYLFEYDDKWINEGFSISPFSLPLKKGVFTPKNMVFNGSNTGKQVSHCHGLADIHAPNRIPCSTVLHEHYPSPWNLCFCSVCIPSYPIFI